MNQVKAKIYYDISTGNILVITSEMLDEVEETTKEQDIKIYPQLKDKSADEIDYIELEYGTLASAISTIANSKSYKINLDTKQLEINNYTEEELTAVQQAQQATEDLANRTTTISEYIYQQDASTVSTFEDLIINTEVNKVMNGEI